MPTPNITINVKSMQGLGDNIYQRPYVKALTELGHVYIDTSWPELYADIENVHFVKPSTTLRTQKKHYESTHIHWEQMPAHPDKAVAFGYGSELERTNIHESMRKSAGVENAPEMDLPDFTSLVSEFTDGVTKPIAFIRPITERKEWLNKARNPKPEYIAKAADILKETHYIVSVGDIDGINEWKIGDFYADLKLEKGEIKGLGILGAIQSADIIVGGIGFIAPAAVATKKKTILIGGGQLGHNHPNRIFNDKMDLSNIYYAQPSPGCYCTNMRHDCNKEIPDFEEGVMSWLSSLKKN